MFTGLVEELGKVKSLIKGTKSVRITISAHTVLTDVKLGDSIAVNGTCLTVVSHTDSCFTTDVMPETVNRTILAVLEVGNIVNLERTLRVGDRLGGHIVSGHIDGTGIIRKKIRNDNAIIISIEADPAIMRYIIPKGSVAIDGISLTVVECTNTWFSVSLIPHTAVHTTLNIKNPGDLVNLENDVVGKYIERFLNFPQKNSPSTVTAKFLQQNGFL